MPGWCERSDPGLWQRASSTSLSAPAFLRVPSELAASMGVYASAAFLVCGVAIGAVAICFAEGGSRMPTSGGAYGYIEAAFGPLAGYIAGTMLWLGNALACGGVAAALADVAVSVVPPRFVVPVHAAVIIGVIGGIALVNIGGVARGARMVDAATALKLIPIAIFVIAGAGAMHRSQFCADDTSEHFGTRPCCDSRALRMLRHGDALGRERRDSGTVAQHSAGAGDGDDVRYRAVHRHSSYRAGDSWSCIVAFDSAAGRCDGAD